MHADPALRHRIPLRDAIADAILRVGEADPTPSSAPSSPRSRPPPTASSPATAAARRGTFRGRWTDGVSGCTAW